MGIKVGIVGLPNVGKSTLFNALTGTGVAAENYPFTTIEPNIGVAFVPDRRLPVLAEIVKPESVVPTSIEFVDIAGLVAGASEGEGLGNQFLSHIRETDAIAHLVRCFADDDVAHVEGEVEPLRDIETINTELALADLGSVERAIERAGQKARSGDKEAQKRLETLTKLQAHIDAGKPARTLELSPDQASIARDLFLLTAKPTMYVANVAEDQDQKLVPAVANVAGAERAPLVVISAAVEGEIESLDDADKSEFLAELGETEPGLNRVVRAAYILLGLNTFFTVGPKEVRAWPFRHGATAREAAGSIHTDFERGFIKAEVVAYDDFVEHGGERGAKDAGRWRQEGKDYPVAEGDLILVRFNV